MLGRHTARVIARLVPRVRAAWPAIGAIALAVVLGHSGLGHLDPAQGAGAHYAAVGGAEGWARPIGILQLVAAAGLVVRGTRVMTAAALVAALVLTLGNQWLDARIGAPSLPVVLLLCWAAVVAWGELRRERSTGAKGLL